MRAGTLRGAAVALVVVAAGAGAVPASDPVPLDDFATPAGWSTTSSPGARAVVSTERAGDGTALRVDYDLGNGTGFVTLRREFRVALPENYAFTFRLRGEGLPNTFEFKLVDRSGRNVWRRVFRDFAFPTAWQDMAIRRSRLAFAWGPTGGGPPHDVGAIEIAVACGEGGAGTLWLENLVLEPRPPTAVHDVTPDVTAASAVPGEEPARAADGSLATAWRSDATGGEQWLLLDLRGNGEFGGLVIDWDPLDYATAFAVEVSADATAWRTIYRTETGHGGRDYVYTPDAEARFIRLALRRGSRGRRFGIAEVGVKPVAFSASPNDFFATIAAEAPPGTYPAYLSGRQTYWTVVGTDGGTKKALLDDQGRFEVDQGAFSVEPFLYRRGALVTWNDVERSHELEEGFLPIPTVTWRGDGVTLRVTAVASGPPDATRVHLRYRLANRRWRREHVRLFLAMRPFQVTPPWQSLNMQGGVAPVGEIQGDHRAVWVDRRRALIPLVPFDGFGATTFEGGSVTEFLLVGQLPPRLEVRDPFGFASAALQYRFDLLPRQEVEVALLVPLHEPAAEDLAEASHGTRPAVLAQAAAVEAWRAKLERIGLRVPREVQPLVDTLRSTVAYILVNRAGPALRPGARNYARSWIRDGAMEAEALLQAGFTAEVRDFLAWYASYQLPDGTIPCCIDRRGPDGTPEHDSNGAFLFALAEYHRHTGDIEFVRTLWTPVVRAVERLEALRRTRLTSAYAVPERRAYYGILPESISHEGYSAHPVHAYWDDFFAVRGIRDAAALAAVVGDQARADAWRRLETDFRASLLGSIAATMTAHGIDYLPGSAELGDFDPTSTSIAIVPGGELARLPRDALERTFERYWIEVDERRRGVRDWGAYSPYELRNVGTFLRLGWRDRAHALLDWIMADRRPLGWNQWAEVSWQDPALARFIGDMPHTWVGAGLVQSVRGLFVYERDADEALVVGAGVLPEWVAASGGVGVRRLPTHYGTLDYDMEVAGADAVRVRLGGSLAVPPGGLVVVSPLDRPLAGAEIDGQPARDVAVGSVVVRTLPAEVVLRYATAPAP